jgi:hypothetical protein
VSQTGTWPHGATALSRLAKFPPVTLVALLALAIAIPQAAAQRSEAAADALAARAAPVAVTPGTGDMTMATFLDRLMLSESGGRDNVANPRSTAVGAFQFISGTFLAVVQRHFAAETAALGPVQILALRTDRAFARRAAEAFTRDNAARLVAAGLAPSWPNLRLAFFAGAEGAVRVLQAEPNIRAGAVLGPGVVAANPFLTHMTARDLLARSARDLQVPPATLAGLAVDPADAARRAALPSKPKKPQITVLCDLDLPSCRRWLALAERRRPAMLAAKKTARRGTT